MKMYNLRLICVELYGTLSFMIISAFEADSLHCAMILMAIGLAADLLYIKKLINIRYSTCICVVLILLPGPVIYWMLWLFMTPEGFLRLSLDLSQFVSIMSHVAPIIRHVGPDLVKHQYYNRSAEVSSLYAVSTAFFLGNLTWFLVTRPHPDMLPASITGLSYDKAVANLSPTMQKYASPVIALIAISIMNMTKIDWSPTYHRYSNRDFSSNFGPLIYNGYVLMLISSFWVFYVQTLRRIEGSCKA